MRLKRRRYSQEDAARKPLWGFGWAGWVLLLIAIGLAVSLITGYDLRYRLQEVVMITLGVDSMMRFTIELGNTAVMAGTWPPGQHFGPIALCIVLLGLHIHPRRVGRVRLAALWLLGIVGPSASMRLMASIGRLFSAGYNEWVFCIGWVATCLVILCVVWFAVRSARVALLLGATLLVPVVVFSVTILGNSDQLPEWVLLAAASLYPHLGLGMHAAIAAIMLTWSIRARFRVLPPHACQSCGYDLRGLPSAPCPECGTPPQQAVDSPSPAAPAATPESSPRSSA